MIRKIHTKNDRIDLLIASEAPEVEVRGAYRGPGTIDNGRLGMQDLQLDAGFQHVLVV